MAYSWRGKDYVERAEWTVLCAGPSLAELSPRDFNPQGPVVAVNFAAAGPVPVDFLCAIDPPECFLDRVLEDISRRVIVWCAEGNIEKWRSLGFRTWHFPGMEVDFREMMIPERCPDIEVACYMQTSMFPAIGMAIHCGARILNIYGCDMVGEGGFRGFGKQDHEKTPDQWEDRWVDQRQQLEEMQSYWELDPGVDFIYHNKTEKVEA